MLNPSDTENFSQSLLDNGRRKKIMTGKNQVITVGTSGSKGKPLIIMSPMNKSKQHDLFSQTGKLNAQFEADIMLDDNS